MKKFLLLIIISVAFTGTANAQKLEGYNDFNFGMTKNSAYLLADIRDYYMDTVFTYDADAQMPPVLSESFIYYSDTLDINGKAFPMDITLYFDPYNNDELFDVDVSIKTPLNDINEAKSYFAVIFDLMKEKYGSSFRHYNEKDTIRVVNTLFNRKFDIYDWDMDNGRVSIEHDLSSFYTLNEDYYYTNELKEDGYLEVTIYYFDTNRFFKFSNSKDNIDSGDKEDIKRKL